VPHVLIIEARFYEDLSDELAAGAIAALEKAGATYDRVAVPGALEIPAALAMALDGIEAGLARYDGFVALGCVIRGETTHYEIVSGESARALMDLAVSEGLAIGNGILTVENDEQAYARARVAEMNKGGAAAEAALAMIALRQHFGRAK
jgi:6,7-dimethyl-8-ribityllumazine synthase